MPNSLSNKNTLEQDKLKNIAQEIVAQAKKEGASEVETSLSIGRGLSINARQGEVETIEHHRDQGVGITVYMGKKKGFASTTDLKQSSIKETVNAACSIAHYATEDEFSGLPDKELLASCFPDLSVYHPWAISADEAVDMAIECEAEALGFDTEISNSEGASVSTFEGMRVLANSHGFVHGYPATRHSISCSVIGEREGNMQRDYWYAVSRNKNDLESAKSVGEMAAKRTLSRLGSQSLTTRKSPVMFAAEVAGGFIGNFISAIRGGNLYRKSTFLLDSLDKKIFPEFVRIHELPHLAQALGSSAYDSEGVATKDRDIVTDGVLQGYVLSSYSARKLGMQSTANAGGVHNLTVDAGDDDFKAMLQKLDTGLLVTELMGQGVNTLTGDYSRGAAGFWVENGLIQYPVEEITIAGNLKEMFQGVLAIGNDVDLRGNIRTGSILINEMTIAGQ